MGVVCLSREIDAYGKLDRVVKGTAGIIVHDDLTVVKTDARPRPDKFELAANAK